MKVETVDQPVQGDVVRRAVENIDLYCLHIGHVLCMYFENQGMVLDRENYYSLREIKAVLEMLFGEATNSHLMALVESGIKSQYYK